MAAQKNPKPNKLNKTNIIKRFPFGWLLVFFLMIIMMNSFKSSPIAGISKEISYSQFYQTLKNNPEKLSKVIKIEDKLEGDFSDNTKFFVNIPQNDPEMLSLMRQNLA